MALDMLKDVLIEELDRKHKAYNAFQANLDNLSYCGKLQIKVIHGNEYGYIKYRQNKNSEPKIICIGILKKINPQKLEEIKEESNNWFRLIRYQKEVMDDANKLEKMIKILC
ncbi:MAG: hypothetical protein LUG12_02980 [Erysipelotrichaceae bacterium]|nr:hypothetical protein [Erysipelotrichaceae bacterium]